MVESTLPLCSLPAPRERQRPAVSAVDNVLRLFNSMKGLTNWHKAAVVIRADHR